MPLTSMPTVLDHAIVMTTDEDTKVKTKDADVTDVKEMKRSAEECKRAQEIKQRRTARVPNIKPKTNEASTVFDHKMLEENLAKMQDQASIVLLIDLNKDK